ncbi:MAG: peroxiredoxin family protein, partial [Verrucomicrobiota bacterium]
EAEDIESADEFAEDAKHIDKMRLAMARLKAGQTDLALQEARELAKKKELVLPLARAAHLFELCEQPEEAEKAFEDLRKLSARADIELPVFARLTPIAERLKLPKDWRLELDVPDDLGERPDLDTLGPFRWSPSRAPSWSLVDTLGRKRSFNDYAGQPMVLIFYLGFGCLHCVEQLQVFAPEADTFREAGIEIIAISTESEKELSEKAREYIKEGENIPFPLLANSDLDVFKSYRAYDDFEQTPLHGTFLIDGQGDIRWQDISYQPFTNLTFIVEESRRLLGRK